MMEDLKPCPFCGGEAKADWGPGVNNDWHSAGCADHKCPGYQPMQIHKSSSEAAAAWNRRAALPADPVAGEPAAVVYPPDGTASPFTVIGLGHGKVQMGDSIHDGRLPALWFGKNGKGMGHEEDLNREAREGETLAVVTLSNVEGLDVLLEVLLRIRRLSFPEAQPLRTCVRLTRDQIDKALNDAKIPEYRDCAELDEPIARAIEDACAKRWGVALAAVIVGSRA